MFNLQMLTTVCCSAHLFPAIQQLLTMIAVMRGMTMVILTLLERKNWWHNRRWNSCPRSGFSATKWVWLKLQEYIEPPSMYIHTWENMFGVSDIHCLHMCSSPSFSMPGEVFIVTLTSVSQSISSVRKMLPTGHALFGEQWGSGESTWLLAYRNCSYVHPFYM